MFLSIIDAFAETASFRMPETHTFHKTLPLPPYTSCVGMLGAALGLSLQETFQWVADRGVRVGVSGRDRGGFKDLWKYRKVKSNEVISDVLLREYRVDLSLRLVFGLEDQGTTEEIVAVFQRPVYALTAGNSDSLMVIRSARMLNMDPEPLKMLSFCVTPGDLFGRYEVDRNLLNTPITETIRALQVVSLPVAFTFDGERREVATRETFTFVGHPITLTEPVEGFLIDDKPVVLR